MTSPVEIPLKLKYRTATKGRFKGGGHNDGRTKRREGWAKHKGNKTPYIDHIPYVVGIDFSRNGKRFKRPAYEDEVPESTVKALAEKGIVLPKRPTGAPS